MKMRPDQHKKKRSSDYKKKHSIDKKQIGHRVPASQESPLEVDSSEESSRKFGKAEIKSNWGRYEEIADEEVDRGEGYAILVSRGGDASSHKKLAGEDDWDAEVKLEDFDIDYKKLASQISRLPPIQRFSLDTLGLNCDILSSFEGMSDNESLSNSTNIDLAPLSCNLNLINKDESSDLGFDFSIKSTPIVPLQTKLNTDIGNVDGKTEEGGNFSNKGDSMGQNETRLGEEIQDDHLLDELLQSAKAIENPDMPDHSNEQQDNVELKTDISSYEVPQGKSVENTEVEDLEDWLDSIL